MDFYFQQQTEKPMDQVEREITELLLHEEFKVIHIHDMQKTFAEKGIPFIPYKILEVCSVNFSMTALDVNRNVGLMMPCPICIWRENGMTNISTMLPTVLANLFPGQNDLNVISQEVENIFLNVVNQVTHT